jgi:hypothetical protein
VASETVPGNTGGDLTARFGREIAGNREFAVNFLATRHDHVSDTFAGRPWPGKDRWDFGCGDWDVPGAAGPGGQPALAAGLSDKIK